MFKPILELSSGPNPRLQFVENYSGLLTDTLTKELLDIYKETLVNNAEQNTGRNHYVTSGKC